MIEQHILDFKIKPKSVRNIKNEYRLKVEPKSVFVVLKQRNQEN